VESGKFRLRLEVKNRGTQSLASAKKITANVASVPALKFPRTACRETLFTIKRALKSPRREEKRREEKRREEKRRGSGLMVWESVRSEPANVIVLGLIMQDTANEMKNTLGSFPSFFYLSLYLSHYHLITQAASPIDGTRTTCGHAIGI
jgi:muconolactone delta-isomerase